MFTDSIEFCDFSIDQVQTYSKSMPTIFRDNIDIDKTAILNWRIDKFTTQRRQLVVMGDAFFSAAYNLLNQCLNDNHDKKADAWIFPIMFNVVHGIEIYLKGIIMCISIVTGNEIKKPEGGHDIKQLSQITKKRVLEYKTTNKNDTTNQMWTAIKVVEKFIDNIYDKTSDMTFARYPMDKNSVGHFYIQSKENVSIDLELLHKQMIIVYKMLNFIFDVPELEVELTEQMLSDLYY